MFPDRLHRQKRIFARAVRHGGARHCGEGRGLSSGARAHQQLDGLACVSGCSLDGGIEAAGFRKEDFAEFHPGGALGRRLTLRVKDVMHSGEALPVVGLQEEMKRVISLMTSKDVRGVAGVVDEKESLIGIITDGDILAASKNRAIH